MPKLTISIQKDAIIAAKRLECVAKLHKFSMEEALSRSLASKLHPTQANQNNTKTRINNSAQSVEARLPSM
ncbi:MAG: hypothetical protein P8R37_01375 [Opitutae bacterium]|jgi:hypothetical protein|nr:hypothetical protein [Opitutae bacterium]MDG1300222.1 hypothetical protein [Opitutae bacterium]